MEKEFYFKSAFHFSNYCYKYIDLSDSDLEAMLSIYDRAVEGDQTCLHLINRFTALLKFDINNKTEINKILFIARENCYGDFSVNAAIRRAKIFQPDFENARNILKDEDYQITDEFFKIMEELVYVCGLYFLFDENKELIYIGKSRNLSSRVPKSIKERKGFYLKYKLTSTMSDANILELYYISKLKPKLNKDSKESDDTTFEINYKFLEKSDFIKIRGEK